jgi:orotate phosphoribosyltransferase
VALSPDDPFTWASGLKSPIYCDNRATLAHPLIRSTIAAGFVRAIREKAAPVEAVIGVATGAIAHASFVAGEMSLPLGYVRSAAKQHGRRNLIEGYSKVGARVVVIEDLISTGGSSLAAVEGVREAGMDVAHVFAIFTYGFPFAHEAFEDAGVPLTTLVDFPQLLAVARSKGILDAGGESVLEEWSRDPKAWSRARGGEG